MAAEYHSGYMTLPKMLRNKTSLSPSEEVLISCSHACLCELSELVYVAYNGWQKLGQTIKIALTKMCDMLVGSPAC